jgi:DNA-binding NtrC family response regulator
VTPVPPAPRGRTENERATVLLVDADRLGRVALARALVSAGFDVLVLDEKQDILDAIIGKPVLDLLLTEIDGIDVDAILRTFVAHQPGMPVLVWTKAARATADHVLRVSDVGTFEIFAKAARIAEVVEGARRLARV